VHGRLAQRDVARQLRLTCTKSVRTASWARIPTPTALSSFTDITSSRLRTPMHALLLMFLPALQISSSDDAAYRAAVEALRNQVALAERAVFDPRAVRFDPVEGPAPAANDSHFEVPPGVAAALAGIPGFRPCLIEAGACRIPPGATTIAFTRLHPAGAQRFALGVVITERVDEAIGQRAFVVTLRRGDAWVVDSVRHAWSASVAGSTSRPAP
jgi:hypothetical protein